MRLASLCPTAAVVSFAALAIACPAAAAGRAFPGEGAALAGSARAATAPGAPAASGSARGAAPAFPTRMVRDVNVGPAGSDPRDLTQLGGILLFTAFDRAHGRELWRTDGTAAGTQVVRDIAPGPLGSDPQDLVVASGVAFFSADDGVHGRELWRSDGTDAGTQMVADIRPGRAGSGPADLTSAVPAGEQAAMGMPLLYFAAGDGVHGVEPWMSDGTGAGTTLVTDVRPGAAGSGAAGLTAIPGGSGPPAVAFSADDGIHGRELWFINGSPPQASLLADIQPGPAGSDPADITADSYYLGQLAGPFPYVLCSADDGVHGREPVAVYLPNPVINAVPSVYDLRPGPVGSFPSGFHIFFFELAFAAAADGVHGREPFQLDAAPLVFGGTPPGPPGSGTLVADLRPGSSGSAPAGFSATQQTGSGHVGPGPVEPGLTQVSRTYMTADDGIHGRELWRLDDEHFGPFGFEGAHFVTGIDTDMVANIWPGRGSSAPGPVTLVNATALFAATTAGRGRELWRSGGDPQTTALVADIRPGPASSVPHDLTAVGDVVYFSANDRRHGRELWATTVPPGTMTSLTGPAQPPAAGAAATFTIEVSGEPGQRAPTGTVTVTDTGIPLGTVSVAPGSQAGTAQATFTVALPAGPHHLLASYSGDTTQAPSTSPPWDLSIPAASGLDGSPSAAPRFLAH
jgi:ELWxxDGT repeat protein